MSIGMYNFKVDDIVSNNKLYNNDWWYISYKHKDKVYWDRILQNQKLSFEFLERNLYCFSLYQPLVCNENLDKLREKYSDKYYIDKLAHELRAE